MIDGPAPPTDAPVWTGRTARLARTALHIVIPLGVVFLVREELRHLNLAAVRTELAAGHLSLVLAAAAAGIVAVGAMGLYDVLSFPRAGAFGPLRRWGLGSTCFAWTNFLTLGPIGGPALRLHFYRQAGMPVGTILRGVARMYAGMFAGLAAWVAVVLLPLPISDDLGGMLVRTAMVAVVAPLLAVAISFLATRWRRLEKARAPWWVMALMGLVGVIDWGGGLAAFALAAHALGVERPMGELARTMVIGNVVGMASLIPGGLGAADGIWLHRLRASDLDANVAAAVAVMFRLTFYVVPWSIGLAVLVAAFTRRSPAAAALQRAVLALATAVNAVLLLAAAAAPSRAPSIQEVADVMPLDVREVPRAVAAVSAAIMLFLGKGLLVGSRAAFVLCGCLLLASIGAHVLSGTAYREAAISCTMLILLLGARRSFDRRGRIPIGWELTLGAALGSTAFVVLATVGSFPEVRFTSDLWLRFRGEHAEAARLLRAAALVAGVGLVFLVRQAVRPARADESPGDPRP
jgi:phosphatidylglycerol lysyltransferase